jgi:hypothetical protein
MTRQSRFARDIFSRRQKFLEFPTPPSLIAPIPIALVRIPRYESRARFAPSRDRHSF